MSSLDYIIISIIHGIYLLGIYFVVSKLFRMKYVYGIIHTLILGITLGLALDAIAVIFFRFWEYPIDSPLLYIFVILGWYIPAVPIGIASIDIYLSRTAISIKNHAFRKKYYWIELFVSVTAATMLGLWRTSVNTTVAPDWFFPIMLALAIFLSDGLLGLVKESGLVTRFFNGNYFAVLAPFIVGALIGVLAEFLNIRLPLYNIINTPEGNFLGIPTFALIGWGIVNLGYWTMHKLIISKPITKLLKV